MNGTVQVIAPDQRYRGKNYAFVSWSDGGARQHSITVPSTPATYTATYRRVLSTSFGFGGLNAALVLGSVD